MRIAPIDITHKTFSKKMLGIDPQEVYDFLRDVADQMEELVRERQRLKDELAKKDSSLVEYIERDQALRATIQAASKMSDQFRMDAEKESQLIINDARQRAEMLMKDARDSLKKMYYDIADLKKARLQYETTLRSLMLVWSPLLAAASTRQAARIAMERANSQAMNMSTMRCCSA